MWNGIPHPILIEILFYLINSFISFLCWVTVVFPRFLRIKTFLIPFNEMGLFMGDKQQLEEIVNSRKDCYFVGMKTLSACLLYTSPSPRD